MKIALKYITLLLLLLASFTFAGNKYITERHILGTAEKPGESNVIRFDVLDDNGIKYYSIKVSVDYDIPYPQAYTFDDGVTAVVWSYNASVDFYNREGKLLYKHFISDDSRIEYERSVLGSIDGNILALLVTSAKSDSAIVHVIDSENNLLHAWKADYKNISGISFSLDNNLLALSGYIFNRNKFLFTTGFYKPEGKLIGSINRSFRKGEYFSDTVFYAYDNKNTFVVNLNDFTITNTYSADGDQLIAGSYYKDSTLIVAVTNSPGLIEGKWIYNELNLLSVKGSKVLRNRPILKTNFSKVSFPRSSRKDIIYVDGNPLRID